LQNTAENALERQLERLAPRINQIIEDRVNIRGRVERLWEDLETPFALREEPPVWLQVKPLATYFSPSTSRNDTLLFGLRLHAFLETLVGDEPPPLPLGSLPPLLLLPDSMATDSIPTFHVNLPISVTYDDAKALLAEALTGKDYEVQEHIAFTVKDLDLYGRGDTLVARVDFTADVPNTPLSTQGRVFFTGIPLYDPENQAVRIDKFDYDILSRDALANVADWLLRDDFLEATRERLVIPLGANIIALQHTLEEALRDRPVGKYIVLNGTVTDFVPANLFLATDGIQVNLTARGHLTAQIQSLAALRRRPAQ